MTGTKAKANQRYMILYKPSRRARLWQIWQLDTAETAIQQEFSAERAEQIFLNLHMHNYQVRLVLVEMELPEQKPLTIPKPKTHLLRDPLSADKKHPKLWCGGKGHFVYTKKHFNEVPAEEQCQVCTARIAQVFQDIGNGRN